MLRFALKPLAPASASNTRMPVPLPLMSLPSIVAAVAVRPPGADWSTSSPWAKPLMVLPVSVAVVLWSGLPTSVPSSLSSTPTAWPNCVCDGVVAVIWLPVNCTSDAPSAQTPASGPLPVMVLPSIVSVPAAFVIRMPRLSSKPVGPVTGRLIVFASAAVGPPTVLPAASPSSCRPTSTLVSRLSVMASVSAYAAPSSVVVVRPRVALSIVLPLTVALAWISRMPVAGMSPAMGGVLPMFCTVLSDTTCPLLRALAPPSR